MNFMCLQTLLLCTQLLLSAYATAASGDAPVRRELAGLDCNDTIPQIYPGRAEIAGNLIDDDCDGLADEDVDGNPSTNSIDADGDGSAPATGDCNDTSTQIRSGLPEIPGDLRDNDCDALADEDANNNPSTLVVDNDMDTVPLGQSANFFSNGFE